MEIAIAPELLSRDELVHELVVRGTVVSAKDPLKGLINNLRYYLSAEREGIMFDVKVNLDSDRELTRCQEIVGEIHALFSKVWDEIALRTASSKLAHLRGRLGRITTEQGVQTENKEKLTLREPICQVFRVLPPRRASIQISVLRRVGFRRTGRTSWGVGGLHSPVIGTTNWPSSTS
jgi:hypothetical protein